MKLIIYEYSLFQNETNIDKKRVVLFKRHVPEGYYYQEMEIEGPIFKCLNIALKLWRGKWVMK